MPAQKGNRYAVGNPGGGSPEKFKPEYCRIAYQMCLLGATDIQLADALGVCETTIGTWKKRLEEFADALKRGKFIADAKVAEALYHRAIGYQHPDEEIKVVDGQVVRVPTTKHYPPDTGAAMAWLKNRQPKQWRDKHELEITSRPDIAERAQRGRERANAKDNVFQIAVTSDSKTHCQQTAAATESKTIGGVF